MPKRFLTFRFHRAAIVITGKKGIICSFIIIPDWIMLPTKPAGSSSLKTESLLFLKNGKAAQE
jgi:hypothetical protein